MSCGPREDPTPHIDMTVAYSGRVEASSFISFLIRTAKALEKTD